LAAACLILALARPQTGQRQTDQSVRSADLVLALDMSESMSASDIRPSRLEAAKRVLARFVDRRAEDRIALVAFSGEAFTIMPLTTDHATLKESLGRIEREVAHVQGTAVGDAVLVGINRLMDAAAPSTAGAEGSAPSQGRALILATDGVSNRGEDPLACAAAAAEKGIRIYAIGLGGDQPALRMTRDYDGTVIPLTDAYGRKQYYELPDEAALRRMAAATHGQYFRAGDARGFEAALEAVDKLEKRTVHVKNHVLYQEHFAWPLLAALALMVAEGLLARLRFRRLV